MRSTPGSKAAPGSLRVLLTHQQAGRLAEADAGYQRLLKERPADPDAWHLWGVLAAQQKQFDAAAERIERALHLKPHEPVFLGNLANVFLQQGQLGHAIARYAEAVQREPANEDIRRRLAAVCERQLDRGIEHQKAGRLDEADACYRDVLQGQPERADAWHLLGVIASESGRYDTAVEHIGQAIKLAPETANFHNSLGSVRQKQQRYEEAIACYQQALRLQPDLANAHANLGQVYVAQGKIADAEAACRKVLQLRPASPEAHCRLGIVLKASGRRQEAQAELRTAIRLAPDDHEARFNLGLLLRQTNTREALACFEQVQAANPSYPYVAGWIADCRARLCIWDSHAQAIQQLVEGVRGGYPCARAFLMLHLADDPSLQRRCAEQFAQTISAQVRSVWTSPRHMHERIRLAYVSPDYRSHPTAYLIADLIEQHDRSRFEVFGVSIGPATPDPWRERLRSSFDHFLDVRGESDESVIERLRALEIDIAVDLAGYTAHNRAGLFAARLAPIQVNYLGFPCTMGAQFIDYIVADRGVIPAVDEPFYTEKVVCLPDTYQCNARRPVAEHTPMRREAGLPESGFVFCCFNNTHKIHPAFFDIWMRLLNQVDGSILWLLKPNEEAESNLRREAVARGVNPERLIFAPRLPQDQHLARQRLADLFLDTLPYNAHTSTSDALWAGLPVLTCRGTTFAGRVASSLLQAVGLPELVTENLADYEALALRLATDPDALAALKQKLERNRPTAPLFDVDRFRRHMEAAYQRMYDTWARGEPPAAFVV